VLLHDPEAHEVRVPDRNNIAKVVAAWEAAARVWRERFEVLRDAVTKDISDPRVCSAVEHRALALLHAE
jgi:hypothetical protein